MVFKSASSRKRGIYPSYRSQQTFPPEGQKKGISVSDEAIYSRFDFTRIAIPLAADSLAPFQFRPADQTSTCGRRSIWLAKQAEAKQWWVLCAVEGDDDAPTSTPPSVASHRVVARRSNRHRRATSSWRRRQRSEGPGRAVVNDATWQVVKKLVTLTVPLCDEALAGNSFLARSLLFRAFFVSPESKCRRRATVAQ